MKAALATLVIFRKFVGGGDVIAIFPAIPYDLMGLRMSYQHIGQHGGCGDIVDITTPATPEEYAPLLEELGRIGYENLEVRKRETPKMRATRYTEAIAGLTQEGSER
jgi:hypothetical protein